LRIVSLLASATEIVCALGAGEQLVGRSHECDNPSWVRSLPGCSEPAFDIGVSSGDIDREVRRLIRAGEPLYRIHTDRIRQLAPDLIVAQSHCEVCAVTPGDVERNNCLGSARVLSLSASTVEEVFSSILDVARALGLEQQGLELVARERKRLERLRQRTSGRRRPSVVVLEWADPIFPMSNWGPELVEAANGALAIGNAGEHSSAIPSEHVREADPELLVVAPCGFDLNRSIQELPVLERNPWWPELRAVRERKVIFADGNLFFNRAGTTVVRTAEMLAEMMHGIVSGERTYGRHWRWIEDVYAAGRATA
jgi:iron complex transport system substrate-binding protein